MDTTLLTGYARCSTDEQDLTAQYQALLAMGVPTERIYTDKGLTGTNRNRPGLDQALAAVRAAGEDPAVASHRLRRGGSRGGDACGAADRAERAVKGTC
jgi:DNA invertase Pin-like site-specific DNA recombinase